MPRKTVSLERTENEMGKTSKATQPIVRATKGPTDREVRESAEQFSDASIERKMHIWQQDGYPNDQLFLILEDMRQHLINIRRK